MNFFEKMFLVITDFRIYPFLLKHEKMGTTILYMAIMVLLMSAIVTGTLFSKCTNILNEFIEDYDRIIPEFELDGSNLIVYDKKSYDFRKNLYILINTDYSYNEFKQTAEYDDLFIYDAKLLINNDRFVLELDGEEFAEFIFSDIGITIDKAGLLTELLRYQNDFGAKLCLLIYIYLLIAISYFITVFFRIIFIALIASLLSLLFGIKASSSNYIKLSIYAYTLPFIIEIISICAVGTIKDYAYYTSMILTYVYVLYALRAVKLDAFITLFSSDKKENESKDENSNLSEDKNEEISHDGENKDKSEKDNQE